MQNRMGARALVVLFVAFATVVGGPAVQAVAKGGGGGGGKSVAPTGYDVSYPQCGSPFPTNVTFGIVGVNDGIVYSPNPCLGTGDGPSELAWAQQAANHAPWFYANTADPGPAYSSHWPTGQTAPQPCDGSNSSACSYDYGWNAAKDSFNDAVVAEQQVNGTTAAAAASAAAAGGWWLDVETANSWQTLESAYGQTDASKQNDVNALAGAVAALNDAGVTQVGFYSTGLQWTQITGSTGQFPTAPSWLTGYTNLNAAKAACTATGFTGGPVKLTQYQQTGFDADYACP